MCLPNPKHNPGLLEFQTMEEIGEVDPNDYMYFLEEQLLEALNKISMLEATIALQDEQLLQIRDGALLQSSIDLAPSGNSQLSSQEKEEMQRAKKFSMVVHEILDTEEIFVEDLKFLLAEFAEPARRLLPKETADEVFSPKLGEILRFHENILRGWKRLGSNASGEALAKEFAQHAREISSVYLEYFKHQSKVTGSMAQIRCNSAAVNDLIKEKEQLPGCRGLDVLSFLIKPVQRITKYPLLFRELLKHASENDKQHLEETGKILQQELDELNAKQSKVEKERSTVKKRLKNQGKLSLALRLESATFEVTIKHGENLPYLRSRLFRKEEHLSCKFQKRAENEQPLHEKED
eukprot:Lithocolla_globosa_v1_NODE_1529_length_2511_cov_49.335505.p1 type:complete len:350 gc:universal NODE_1529_length_2511_cov_49.335505:51-1100(+)